MDVLSNRLAGLRSELTNESRKLADLQNELTSLPTGEGSAAYESEALSLGKQARDVPAWRSQLADCSREMTELERELSEALRKLGWSLQDSQWRSLNLDLTQLAELDSARASLDQLSSQLTECITRIDMAEKQLHLHRPPKQESITGSPGWDRVLEIETQLRGLRPLAHELDQHRKELTKLRNDARLKQWTETLQALSGPATAGKNSGETEFVSGWQVPTVQSARQLHSELLQASKEVLRLEQTQLQAQQQRDALKADIAKSQSRAGVKSLAELEAIWCQRDQIVSHWHDELRTPLLASTVSPTEYDERLTQLRKLNEQSDSAVRAMLAAVEQVALVAAKERQLAVLDAALADATGQCQQARHTLNACQAAWQELWSSCPITKQLAHSLTAGSQSSQLIEWLEAYLPWEQAQATIQQKSTELQTCEARTPKRELRYANCGLRSITVHRFRRQNNWLRACDRN